MPFEHPAPGALDGLRCGARGSRALDEHRAGAAEACEALDGLRGGCCEGAHQDWLEVTGEAELEDPEEAAEATDAEEVALCEEAPTVAELEVFVWDEIRVTSPTNSATPVPITPAGCSGCAAAGSPARRRPAKPLPAAGFGNRPRCAGRPPGWGRASCSS